MRSYHSVDIRPELIAEKAKSQNVVFKRLTKFKAPFEMYYYRDFMWKVAFSNGLLVEPVEVYEGKLKMFIGPGNNSNLIKGIMRRRPWWTVTDKAQDACFVWTQIKVAQLFGIQRKGERLPQLGEEDTAQPVLKETKKPIKNVLLNVQEDGRWEKYWRVNMDNERKIK